MRRFGWLLLLALTLLAGTAAAVVAYLALAVTTSELAVALVITALAFLAITSAAAAPVLRRMTRAFGACCSRFQPRLVAVPRRSRGSSDARGCSDRGSDLYVEPRDPVMADNVARLLHQAGPDAKVVVWAHNGHVSKADGAMGGYLKRRFGDQAYLVGFEFAHGSFTSRTVTVHTFSVGPASPAYYAYALNRVGAPMLFLDFKSAMGSAELRSWLRKDLRSHDFAELYAVFPSLAAMGTPSTRAGWGRTTVSFSPGRAHLLSQWAAHPRRQAS